MKIRFFLMMCAFCTGFSCENGNESLLPGSGFAANESVPLTPEEIQKGILTPEILWKFGRLGDFSVSPDGASVVYEVTCYDLKENKGYTSLRKINLKGGVSTLLSPEGISASYPRWHPSGEKIGFLRDGQIWEMHPEGSDLRPVSDIEGKVTGFAYAPSGDRLFYLQKVKMSKSLSDRYPDLPKAHAITAESLGYRHWDQWDDHTRSHIFVAEIQPGEILKGGKDILEGEPFDTPLAPYFDPAEIAWSPDGERIAYTCKKLSGTEAMLSTNSDIFLYTLADQSTRNLTEGMPGYDRNPVFSGDGRYIAFQSMATPGYESDKERLMVLDLQTGRMKDLTAGFDRSASGIVWDTDRETLFFICVNEGTTQIYKVSVETPLIEPLTQGTHDYMALSHAKTVLVGKKMSMSMAPELFLVDPYTGEETPLTHINRELYEHIALGNVQAREIRATDGEQILTWIIYPPDFDPSHKYPLLLFCEGGPQTPVSQFFSFRWNFQLMAANGYVVVAPNRRGLAGFGQAWTDQIAGDYGGQNMKDYLSAIDAVSDESWADSDRMGAVGASYGGYSVYWLAGHHQKRFKTFIAHCGMFNLESQYASTEEYWFVNHDLEGPYWDNPKPGSYRFSPHLYVQNWDTPLMVIHGGRDYRIPYTESLQAFNAAQLRGIPSKLLFFPEESHWVTRPQNSIVWHREFFDWLSRWLK